MFKKCNKMLIKVCTTWTLNHAFVHLGSKLYDTYKINCTRNFTVYAKLFINIFCLIYLETSCVLFILCTYSSVSNVSDSAGDESMAKGSMFW